jgi:ectoine hydroxylase-related dioxygenase (phytanoyl-CoA dioxygenase family)
VGYVKTQDWAALNLQFLRDGVVCVKGALDDTSIALAEEAYNWSLDHPTSHNKEEGSETAMGRFYQDFFNPDAMEHYQRLLLDSSIPDVLTCLWNTPDVWFMFEHVFIKEGSTDSRPTSWHQDSQDLPVEGSQFATVWMSFAPVGKDEALEFVRGSHWGVRFAAAARNDPEAAKYLPPVPDVPGNRDRYEIVSWATEPGDLLIFHPAMLHGGAPTLPGSKRRTLSMRFFGTDAVYAPRVGSFGKVGPANFGEAGLDLTPGDPFRHAAFPRVRPRDEAAVEGAADIRRLYRPLIPTS